MTQHVGSMLFNKHARTAQHSSENRIHVTDTLFNENTEYINKSALSAQNC